MQRPLPSPYYNPGPQQYGAPQQQFQNPQSRQQYQPPQQANPLPKQFQTPLQSNIPPQQFQPSQSNLLPQQYQPPQQSGIPQNGYQQRPQSQQRVLNQQQQRIPSLQQFPVSQPYKPQSFQPQPFYPNQQRPIPRISQQNMQIQVPNQIGSQQNIILPYQNEQISTPRQNYTPYQIQPQQPLQMSPQQIIQPQALQKQFMDGMKKELEIQEPKPQENSMLVALIKENQDLKAQVYEKESELELISSQVQKLEQIFQHQQMELENGNGNNNENNGNYNDDDANNYDEEAD